MDGYRLGMTAATGRVDDALVVECAYVDLVSSAYDAAIELLRRDREVTAVLAAADEHALGIYRAAADLGRPHRRRPGGVSIDGTGRVGTWIRVSPC